MLVEKRVFTLAHLETEAGRTIRDVRIGWESYGRLNAHKSNAILVTHHFSGTSHAAGRYRADDVLPGYWDAVIGPGKAFDTDRYFVLSSDTLANLNARTSDVVTTGPASIDPGTGRPYGLTFPVVSVRDMVSVQKALVDSLGITRLKAVAGPSMGALQAYEWAVSYPEAVERIVPVIGAAGGDAFLTAWLDVWAQPVRLDPNWNGGDYYGGVPPLAGLTAAIKVIGLHANGPEWAAHYFGRLPAQAERLPADDLSHDYKIVAALDAASRERALGADANHLLYLARANQLAAADPTQIHAPTLVVSSAGDLVFPPAWIDRTIAAIRSAGTPVEHVTISGPNGHLDGLLAVGQAAPAIAAFLERDFGRS